jgi:hypothetical protein
MATLSAPVEMEVEPPRPPVAGRSGSPSEPTAAPPAQSSTTRSRADVLATAALARRKSDSVIRPKRIYFPEHFCYYFSSNLCVLNTTNTD